MLEYTEKRNFPRMMMDCPARFQLNGEQMVNGAVVKELSGGGLLLWIERDVEPGSVLRIDVLPVKDITPPMTVEVKVVRCTPVEGADGNFAVACQMEKIVS